MSWNDVWEEHIKPRLFRVCPRTFYDHQMTVLLKIYKSEDMANDSRRFTEWFDRASGTICELCKRPRDTSCQQPESVGQHDPNWPVMHQGDYLVIHFQSPIESSINLQEGDCFFSVTGPEEHGGGLLFNYKKHEQVIKKVIPPDDLGHAFSEDYLDKLLSESGSTISSFNIIVVTASKQTKRVSLAEFALCPQEPTGDVVQDASNQERQNDTLTLEAEQRNWKMKSTQMAQQVSSAYHDAASSVAQVEQQLETQRLAMELRQTLEQFTLEMRLSRDASAAPTEEARKSQDKSGMAKFESQSREHIIAKAKKYLPEKIKDMRFNTRTAIAKMIDPPDPNFNDWRMVGDELGLSNDDIRRYSTATGNETPTLLVLEHCQEISCARLVDIFEQLKMYSVLEAICRLKEQAEERLGKKAWRSANFDDRLESESAEPQLYRTVSMPVDNDSDKDQMVVFGIRSKLVCTASAQSEERRGKEDTAGSLSTDDALGMPDSHINNLYDPAAREFWTSIKVGTREEKLWTAFIAALKDKFRVPPNSTVEKGLFHILVNDLRTNPIRFSKRKDPSVKVTMTAFTRLIKWFGPATTDEHGFVRKFEDLLVGSRRNPYKASWFAGYMDQSEASSLLQKEAEGTFLVRFSSTLIDEGGFALNLSLGNEQSESFHIQSQSHPEGQNLWLDAGDYIDEKFSSLVELIEALQTKPVASEYPVLVRPCPGLPFSLETTPYKSSKRK